MISRSLSIYRYILYMIYVHTHIHIHSWNIICALNTHYHPYMKNTQLATRKIKIQSHETLRWKSQRCPPVNTCRSKGPPKPGSCSKELRPPLGRFLSLGKREGWNIEPKKWWYIIMNVIYIYTVHIYYHSLFYLKITICTSAPFCFRSIFAMI